MEGDSASVTIVYYPTFRIMCSLGTNRAADLNMMALFNARDWTANDWRVLFSEAGSRFVLRSVIQPTGSALAILDLRCNAEG